MILKLRTPFKSPVTSKMVEEVTLRDYMLGGDVLAARRQGKGDDIETSFHLLARLAGLDVSEIEHMDVRDIEKAQEHARKVQETDPS